MNNKAYNTIKLIQQAILRGEQTYRSIKLPSGQFTGKALQKSTYAFLKAQEIYQQHFSLKTSN